MMCPDCQKECEERLRSAQGSARAARDRQDVWRARAESAEETLRRWATLKNRVLEMKRHRERCEAEEPGCMGDPMGTPPCWDAPADDLEFSEWCGPCQRNRAKYLYREFTAKALRSLERSMRQACTT